MPVIDTPPAVGDRSADATVADAMAQIEAGNGAEAAALLRGALEEGIADPRLKHQLGRALLAQGRLTEAVGALVEAAEEAPDNLQCILDLGRAVLTAGWPDQAAIAARRAVELDAMSVDAFMLLASALEASGSKDDALQAMHRAVELLREPLADPGDPIEDPPPFPLHVGEGTLLFLDFEAKGGAYDLCLCSTSPEGRHRIAIKVAAGATTCQSGPGRALSQGEVPRERLLACLPAPLAAKVELYDDAAFDYTLYELGD